MAEPDIGRTCPVVALPPPMTREGATAVDITTRRSPAVFTRRIFDGVLLTVLTAHVAFGLPRMWARKELIGSSGPKRLFGRAILAATS